jgi:flagellin
MSISLFGSEHARNTLRNLSTIQRSLLKTGRKLSSGQRINSAADDPAGLVISEKMRAQIASISQELSSLDNSVNMSNVADQAMTSMTNQLIDLRDLAIGAANSAMNDDVTMQAYQNAAAAVVTTYNSMAADTSYAGNKLLDGSENSLLEVGSLENIDFSTPDSAVNSIERIDNVLTELSNSHIELGASTKYYVESFQRNMEVTQNSLISSESTIRDADFALENVGYVNFLMRENITMAVLAQGNLMPKSVFGVLSS